MQSGTGHGQDPSQATSTPSHAAKHALPYSMSSTPHTLGPPVRHVQAMKLPNRYEVRVGTCMFGAVHGHSPEQAGVTPAQSMHSRFEYVTPSLPQTGW